MTLLSLLLNPVDNKSQNKSESTKTNSGSQSMVMRLQLTDDSSQRILYNNHLEK